MRNAATTARHIEHTGRLTVVLGGTLRTRGTASTPALSSLKPMQLDSLKLKNFRGFRELLITFDPSFTILLGGNMAGKTAVLEAAALALSRLLGEERSRNVLEDAVFQVIVDSGGVPTLQPQFPVYIEATIGDPRWGGSCRLSVMRESDRQDNEIPFTILNRPLDEDLPVLAYYGVQRHWDREPSIDDARGVAARYDAYVGAFSSRSTHGQMVGWVRRQTYVQLQKGSGYIQPQLAAVEAAVKSCIGDVKRFWFDVQVDALRVERAGGDIQSFAMLSEGYRNMVAMVADIAWRASVLNPHHGREAHLLTDGVVLIDELDLHLHPAWQRRIIGDLRRTFPKLQFIVTTHSPQIVASVSRQQVRLLDHNQLVVDQLHVEGRDSNELLEDVFGVARRPEPIKAEIDEIYQLIEETRFTEAQSRLARLEERFGPDDATIVRIKWILETEDARSPTEPSTPA